MRNSNAMIMAFTSADITDALSCNLSPKAILWVGINAPLTTFSFILDPSTKILKWFLYATLLSSANFSCIKAMGVSSLVHLEKSAFIMGIDQLHGGFGGMWVQ